MTRDGGPKVVAIVPARMASSRFPGKPLVPIRGLPMVEHVRRRVKLARAVDSVLVATCDDEIRRTVVAHGGTAVMTSSAHERAVDRVAEAARVTDAEVVVMAQGDEPLLDPRDIDRVIVPLLADQALPCTNLLSPLDGPQDAMNPDVVKAALAADNHILFLTRAPIPYARIPRPGPVFRQTGIMAFRAEVLERFTTTPATPLEQIESIDILRLLESGTVVHGVVTDHATQGVDRPPDVAVVEALLERDPHQRALLEQVLAAPATSRWTH